MEDSEGMERIIDVGRFTKWHCNMTQTYREKVRQIYQQQKHWIQPCETIFNYEIQHIKIKYDKIIIL